MKTATADPATLPKGESQFVKVTDLMERHVWIIPKSIDTREGERGSFETVTSDVIVLDGYETDKIPSLPFTVRDMWVGGYKLVAELKRAGIGEDTAVLGRLTRESTNAFVLEKPVPKVKNDPATKAALDAYEATAEPPF